MGSRVFKKTRRSTKSPTLNFLSFTFELKYWATFSGTQQLGVGPSPVSRQSSLGIPSSVGCSGPGRMLCVDVRGDLTRQVTWPHIRRLRKMGYALLLFGEKFYTTRGLQAAALAMLL